MIKISKCSLLLICILFHSSILKSQTDSIEINRLIIQSDSIFEVNLDSSIYFLNQAEIIAQNRKMLFLEAKILGKKALFYKHYGKSELAIQYYFKSVDIAETLLEKNNKINQVALLLSANLNDLAEIHADINNLEKAIEYNEKAMTLNNYYGLNNRQINTYITRGKIARLNEDLTMAKVYWQKGLALANKMNSTDLSARLINNLGGLFYYEQKWDSCMIFFKKAYQLQKSIKNEKEIGPAANNVGLIYLIKNNYDSAIFYLNKGHAIADKYQNLRSQAMALNYLIRTYVYASKAEEASQALDKFSEVIDEYYSQESAKTINELEAKYQTEKKEQEIITLQKENELKNQKVKVQRRSILFVGLSAMLLILVGIVLYLFNKTKQKNIRNELQIRNLLTEQKLLRSQMNPHFIYNSLNSIQAFISSDESYQAEKYLARFAKLMRGILENSREDYIELDKEIEVLELYLELEKLRFNNRFNFSIIIDEELETDFISIPPMLIQPFIENAILHGLKTKENGLLTIHFTETNNCLICTIDDNGIGRKATLENPQTKKHKSLATTIITERLEQLEQETKQKAFFKIIDKIDDSTNQSIGTKVTIQIPINEA